MNRSAKEMFEELGYYLQDIKDMLDKDDIPFNTVEQYTYIKSVEDEYLTTNEIIIRKKVDDSVSCLAYKFTPDGDRLLELDYEEIIAIYKQMKEWDGKL